MKKYSKYTVISMQYAVSSKLCRLLKTLLPAYCLLLCCLLLTEMVTAQIYPVQATPQMVPPYSFKLSDYTTTTQEKLFVNLLLTDAQESGRQVRLKLFVEGPGISFQSTDFVNGALPIVLDGGINQRLTNLDLQPYFNLNNLVGISSKQYSEQLPEGQYQFCFEVYDQFSGQRISNRSCANIYLVLNDPPFLNVPFRGDLVTAQEPQNIIFNWTPRHINAPAVQYEFTLKELWDTGMDPQAAFLASPPLYQTTTYATTLHYGPAQTPLLEGKTYGWQVRAFVSDGINTTSLFRNNGLSEIYHFSYHADCKPPRFVLSEAENSQTVTINWQMGEHLRYRVQYRKKGYGEDDWFGLWSQTNEAIIRNLEAGTVYEFRVGGDCIAPLSVSPGGGEGSCVGLAFAPIHEFTTPTEDEMAYYNCGIPPEVEILNQNPLHQLEPYEVFTAGDFPIVVREASGSNGYFSGWGYITLPFLEKFKEVIDVANIVSEGDINIGKFSRIRVEFDNIKINTDYQLVEGMVETSYDPNWSGIVDVDEAIEDIANLLELLSDELNQIVATIKENNELNQQVDAAIEILETNLDDPNNGLTKEQEENIRNFISNRDRVKQTIVEEKEKIANGERDEVIKQNLASHFVDQKETKSNILKEFEIYHCDSIVKLDKHNDILKECNKLKMRYKKEDSTATKTVEMKLKIIPRDEAEDRFFPSKDGWQSVKYNEDWEVEFDSIPSGKYLAELKLNDSIYKHEFRMQKECTSGYCCEVCGRDLTVTLSRLQEIFPKNKNLTQTQATLFSDGLEKGEFNTCKKQVHFFSQISTETKGLEKFKESGGYSFDTALAYHSNKAKVKEVFIKQSFFDENKHLDYFYIRALRNDTVAGTHLGLNYKTYKNGNNQLKIPTGKPNSKKANKDETGVFTKVPYPSKEKRVEKEKRFFNIIYAKTNGNEGGDDGWNYRGQGAIHLTGKEIYEGTTKEANKLFESESFDWKSNPKVVSTKDKDRIYSAVAYFHYRYKKIKTYSDGINRLQKQTTKQVSYDVNGGYNGLSHRQAEYTRISNVYLLNQCK